MNYRSLGDLFYLAEQRKGTFRYDVAVQMIEIYNEQVRDLLVSDGLNKKYPFLILGHSYIRVDMWIIFFANMLGHNLGTRKTSIFYYQRLLNVFIH